MTGALCAGEGCPRSSTNTPDGTTTTTTATLFGPPLNGTAGNGDIIVAALDQEKKGGMDAIIVVVIVIGALLIIMLLFAGIMWQGNKPTTLPPHYQQQHAPVVQYCNQVLQLEGMPPPPVPPPAPPPAPPENEPADYMEASTQQQIMYDNANNARAQRIPGMYVEPSCKQMAEYDAANAAREVNDVDGFRIDVTDPSGEGCVYDRPGAKGGTSKAPIVYAEYAAGMANGAAYGPVGVKENDVLRTCARGGVPGGRACVHIIRDARALFCTNHTCEHAECFNTRVQQALHATRMHTPTEVRGHRPRPHGIYRHSLLGWVAERERGGVVVQCQHEQRKATTAATLPLVVGGRGKESRGKPGKHPCTLVLKRTGWKRVQCRTPGHRDNKVRIPLCKIGLYLLNAIKDIFD
jgi:hypothetical protein